MSTTAEDKLTEYKAQLLSVNEALKHADHDQQADLLDLKSKLEEVVFLLGGNEDNSLRGEALKPDYPEEQPSIDDEFAKFQMEMSLLEGTSVEKHSQGALNETVEENHSPDELVNAMSSLEGSKCRAPFSQPWGEKEYHNALIVSVDFDPNAMESVEDVEVEVMFCHPICDQMKPCPFFLSGYCKFSDGDCRFSHGYRVKFSEVQEFTLPNYSDIAVDSKCLAQSSDGLWYRATIEKCLEDRQYFIKYDTTGRTDTLDAESLIPLGSFIEQTENDDSTDDDTSDEESHHNSYSLDSYNSSACDSSSLGNLSVNLPSVALWEQHNRGIGSKLMEKMGHVWGQGLGKNSDGRLDPVEAIILPAGKSLDKCIEMRETCSLKGPVSIETRLAVEQDKEEQRAKKAKVDIQPVKKETVFDFINRRIAKGVGKEILIKKPIEVDDGKSKSPNLNIEVFSVGEDIRRTRREMSRLQQSLVRNSDRNEAIRAQVEKKMEVQTDILKKLQAKEHKINQEIKSQTNHRKLAIF